MSRKKDVNDRVQVSPGWRVIFSGTLGVLSGLAPLLLIASVNEFPIEAATACALWLVIVSPCVTYLWSTALHDQMKIFREKLESEGVPASKGKGAPVRLRWLPVMVGFFERLLYVALIALRIESAGTFIAAWVGIKLASGWGTWSGGETYGRAIFFSGVLGNAMSILHGLTLGLVLQGV